MSSFSFEKTLQSCERKTSFFRKVFLQTNIERYHSALEPTNQFEPPCSQYPDSILRMYGENKLFRIIIISDVTLFDINPLLDSLLLDVKNK